MMTASDGDFIRNGGTCSRTKGEMNFEEKQFRQPCIIGWATVKEAASSPLSSFCATKKSTGEEQFHLHNEVPAKQIFSDTQQQQDHKMHMDENMYSLEGHDDFDQVVNECFSNLDDDSNDNSKIQEDDKTEHHPPFLCSPTPFRSDQHQNNTHTIVMVSDARSEQSVPSCEPPHSESLCPSFDAIRIFQLDHNADMKPHGGTFQVQPRRHSMPLTPSFFGKQQENQDSEVFHDGDSHNTNMVDLHNKKFIHVEEDVMLLNESHDHHEPLHREEIDTPIIMDGNNSSSSSSQGSRTYSNCTADSQLHRYYYGCPSAKVGVESPWNEQDSVANSPPESIRRLTTVDDDEEAPPVIPPNNGDHHHGHTTPEERRRMDHPKDHPCGASTITTTSNRKVERRGSLPSSFVYMDHPPNANHNNTSTITITNKTSVDTCPSTTFPDSKKEAVIGAPHPLSQKTAIKLATFFPEEQPQDHQDLYCHQQQEEEQQQYPLVMVDDHHNHHHHDPQPPCHHHHPTNQDDNKRMTMTTMMDLDDYGLTTKYRVLMRKSSMSQRALQAWDKSMGLPKNHSPAMVNSSKSRQQLQEGVILTTYRGTPLTERMAMASSNNNKTKMKRRVTSPY